MTLLRPPIILGNAPSSGSTLLANLFGRAPGIYQRNELTVFDKIDWLQADRATFQRQWPSWLRSGYPRRLGCEMRVSFTNYEAAPPTPAPGDDYLDYLLNFMDSLAIDSGCHRWIEKTPANIFAFPTLLRRMPDARFVVIHRDARSVTSSLMRRGFSGPLAAARWYLPNLAAHAVAGHPRVKLIAYEKLVQQPDDALGELFEFVGEAVDPGQLSERSAKASTTLESWRASPTGAISKSALWNEQQHLPPLVREALTRIRPTAAFLDSLSLANAPSAVELQERFGYSTAGCSSSRRSAALLAARARDLASYYGSFVRYGLRPKPIPFSFAG